MELDDGDGTLLDAAVAMPNHDATACLCPAVLTIGDRKTKG